MIKTVLTIAGSDSCCGAGVQADIKAINASGAYGVCAITALTAQNSQGVDSVLEVGGGFVGCQIDSLANDFDIAAVKTGMLVNSDVVMNVVCRVERFGFDLLVVDPVIISKNGKQLLSDDGVKVLYKRLFPLAFLVTPNIPEAEMIVRGKINNLDDMKSAARTLIKLGPKNVLIKGGHLDSSIKSGGMAIDLLFDGSSFRIFKKRFLENKIVHGTGCVLSAVITAELAKGSDIVNAVHMAKEFIFNSMDSAVYLGKGAALINGV